MRAGIAAPMVEDRCVRAVLYVNHADPRHWDDGEVALVEEIVARTWEAVGWARAEATVRESDERFRQFAEHSTNVPWILDAEQEVIEYLNPAFEPVWGQPRDSMLQTQGHWAETMHPDDQTGALDVLARIQQGGDAVTHKYRIIRPDRSVRWIRETCFPIRDGERLRRVAGIAQDITHGLEAVVYVVGADLTLRERLSFLLRGAGYHVQEFATEGSFLKVAPVLTAGCVLLNVQALKSVDSITLLHEIKARQISLPVVIVGDGRGDIRHVVQLMKAGAVNYLTNSGDDPEPVLTAVASALANVRDVAAHDSAAALTRKNIADMPAREREVLQGLLSGATNKQIAKVLGISPRTVELHRANVMDRIGARTLPEAVLLAADAGLRPLTPPGDND
jgi:PAS domain S-box-containing protein